MEHEGQGGARQSAGRAGLADRRSANGLSGQQREEPNGREETATAFGDRAFVNENQETMHSAGLITGHTTAADYAWDVSAKRKHMRRLRLCRHRLSCVQ